MTDLNVADRNKLDRSKFKLKLWSDIESTTQHTVRIFVVSYNYKL